MTDTLVSLEHELLLSGNSPQIRPTILALASRTHHMPEMELTSYRSNFISRPHQPIPEGSKPMTIPTFKALLSPPAHDVLNGDNDAANRPRDRRRHTVTPRSAIEQEQEKLACGAFARLIAGGADMRLHEFAEHYKHTDIGQAAFGLVDQLIQISAHLSQQLPHSERR